MVMPTEYDSRMAAGGKPVHELVSAAAAVRIRVRRPRRYLGGSWASAIRAAVMRPARSPEPCPGLPGGKWPTPAVRDEMNLARQSAPGPAERACFRRSLRLRRMRRRSARQFCSPARPLLSGCFLLLCGFFQGFHEALADAHPCGVVVGADRGGVRADQRQVCSPRAGDLGDQAFQQGGQDTGVPPDAKASVNGGLGTGLGRHLPSLGTGPEPPDHRPGCGSRWIHAASAVISSRVAPG